MPIDLELLKRKMKAIEQRSQKKVFTLKDGINKIRLLPLDNGLFFYETKVYYIDKKKPKLFDQIAFSPASPAFGEEDPILDLATELRREGNSVLAEKISPSTRYFSIVLVRGRETEGPLYWGYGQKTLMEISALFESGDWGDITDLQNGTDLTITYKKNPVDIVKSTIIIQPARSTSPLLPNKRDIEDFMSKIVPLKDIYYYPSKEEMVAAINRLSMNNSEEPENKPAEKPSNSRNASAADFEEMFSS